MQADSTEPIRTCILTEKPRPDTVCIMYISINEYVNHDLHIHDCTVQYVLAILLYM